MNLAIVIGVSIYLDKNNNLPGCKNDAEAIYMILEKTNKFESILYVNNKENSAKIKTLLTNFITENKGREIEELFFYYSGHGEFSNEEFFYILSDFDSKKKKQTSLQNGEIDNLIKTLSPKLVIKVIDACQSGTTYIKENNVLGKYFEDSKKGFNNCYFLNSSLNNQSSFQDQNVSYFTFSFIKALKQHDTNEIRYKDIIDVISDEFEDNNEQTPFFVIQADFTEKFCTISEDLRQYLVSFDLLTLPKSTLKEKPLSIAELVKINAKEYLDKDGALKELEFIKNRFKAIKLTDDISELYNVEIKLLADYELIPRTSVIGQWLKKNKNDFFANEIYETDYDPDDGEPYTILSGFTLNLDLPFKAITIELNSAYPNLLNYQCAIVFLISKRLLRFFYFLTNYIDESWDEKNLNTNGIQWVTDEMKIVDEDAINNSIQSITNTLVKRIKDDIYEKFEIKTDIDIIPGETKNELP